MKKTYQRPDTEWLAYDVEEMLEASTGIMSDDLNIDFGGTDDGSNDPAARMMDLILQGKI